MSSDLVEPVQWVSNRGERKKSREERENSLQHTVKAPLTQHVSVPRSSANETENNGEL